MANLIIQAVEPRDLTDHDFIGIHEVMQDMWASEAWLWELVQCNDCGKMISKENVFWHLSKELTQETVAHVMRVLWVGSIPCTACGWKTRFIYGSENVEKIRDRILNSIDAFLVLCKDGEKGVVGFEEAYVDSLDRMFKLDLVDHYGNIWLPEIKKRVTGILGYLPDEMFLLSSIWLLEPYRNFQNLFEIMHQFAMVLPDSYIGTPGITELNRGGVTHKMNAGIKQGISLGIEDDPVLRAKMTDVGEKYNSDLIVYPNPTQVYKNYFTGGMKNFLRMTREQKCLTPSNSESREAIPT